MNDLQLHLWRTTNGDHWWCEVCGRTSEISMADAGTGLHPPERRDLCPGPQPRPVTERDCYCAVDATECPLHAQWYTEAAPGPVADAL